MGLFKNAVTLLTTPGMLQDWLRWELHHAIGRHFERLPQLQ
jgi:hypothetical protein